MNFQQLDEMEIATNVSKISQFTTNFKENNLFINSRLIDLSKLTLANNDFPTTRNESWKYTRLTKLSQLSLTTKVNTDTLVSVPLNSPYVISIVNGNIVDVPSIPGVNILRMSACSEKQLELVGTHISIENEVFNALNTLYIKDGLIIEIQENQQINDVIQLIFESQESTIFCPTRIIIVSKKGSKAHFIQHFSSVGVGFSLPIFEYFIEQNAHLNIDKIQLENDESFHISTDQVHQERDSFFKINTITLSGKLVRNNLNILVDGENCETNLNGTFLLRDGQLVDNHTIVDHLKPNCNSNELYKGVLNGKSIGVFNGKVFVRQNAQKINAFQSNANVLLSEDASMNSKPELEIYADDVKCSHGSTTGQMDEEAIFYLRTRGISDQSARALMTQAFIGDVLNQIENEEILDYVQSKLVELHDWVI
jgi:Fe-S cluster assembly protein SufD